MKLKFALSGCSLAVLFALQTGCRDSDADGKQKSVVAETLKINGSTTVNEAVAEVAELLRLEKGMDIRLGTRGGSSGGISMLGEGLVDLGMVSKQIDGDDRARYPDCTFKEIQIGEDAVALVVSKDVWNAGVRSISRKEVQGIYEGKISNWKELGGADQRIAFFTRETGHGTREVFFDWVYGDEKDAPEASFPQMVGNEEARNKVATTKGALAQLSAFWSDSDRVFALALEQEDGTLVKPTISTVAKHKYPMSRALYVLSNGEPKGQAKKFVKFLLSERGQEIVRKHGYLALSDLVVFRLAEE